MNCALIDDSNIISQMIISALKPYGYKISHYKGSEVNLSTFQFNRFRLFIVNRSLSSLDGAEFVKKIRSKSNGIFILGVITKGDWKEKVLLLESGADDVLNYPFPMQELIARIQNLVSRPKERIEKIYQVGDALIDIDSRRIMLNDKPVYLRNKEFGILEYLTKNNNRAVSRSEILDNVWDYRSLTNSNTVDVHVSNIRKKLKGEKVIKTIHGFGYKIEDDCSKVENNDGETLSTIS